MSMHQLVLLFDHRLPLAALNIVNLNRLIQSGPLSNPLHIVIHILVRQPRNIVVVLLKNVAQLCGAGDIYPGTRFLLGDSHHQHLPGLDNLNHPARILRILLFNHLLNHMGIDVLRLDIVVIRYTLRCPYTNQKDVTRQFIPRSLAAKVHRPDLIQVIIGQIDGIHLHASPLEHLVLKGHIAVVPLNLCRIHERLQPVDVLANGIQGIVLIIQESQILPVEIHVNFIKIVSMPGLPLKSPQMVNCLLDAGKGTLCINRILFCQSDAGLCISIELINVFLESHPLGSNFCCQPFLLLALFLLNLSSESDLVDDIMNHLVIQYNTVVHFLGQRHKEIINRVQHSLYRFVMPKLPHIRRVVPALPDIGLNK